MPKKTIIHWFRKGLRIHDNPALVEAIKLIEKNPNQFVLRPIFVLDPDIPAALKIGQNRFRFFLQSLQQLDENLKSINSRLYVVRGRTKDVFSRVFKEWNVQLLTFESDIEPYSMERDRLVLGIAQKNNVEVIQHASHTIYNHELVLSKNLGKPVITYQKFLNIVESMKVSDPFPAPSALNTNSQPDKDSYEIKNSHCYDSLSISIIDESQVGPNLYPGGETEALNRLEKYLKQTKWICNFEKPNTSPNSIEPSTTVLSPYLKLGCLSSRLFYKKLKAILVKNHPHSKPPVSLMGQLMWREFYYAVAAATPNFDKMVGNSVCQQIPWDDNKQFLEAWEYGRTGYPFIDAIMRQLRQEGWIHHLARHAVACFLTRGDLWISWESGQLVFEELLLDADWALNAGNWMWLSASAFFYQYFRVYSPVAFGKKTDPEGKYIKKYCPELKKYPSGIIYEPWKANLKSQQEYGCIIGKDYPARIVIHEEIYRVNIGRMAEAYKLNKLAREGNVRQKVESPKQNPKNKRKPESTPKSSTSKKSKTLNNTQKLEKYFKKK